jgi:hypothetical protein
MKAMFAAAIVAVSLLGIAAAAGADDAMNAMSAKPAMIMATMVCRPAKADETPTAMTAGKAPLICKAINMSAVMSMMKSMPPDAMAKLQEDFGFEYGR